MIYYLVKPKYRYIVIFIGSYVFYGFANPMMLLTLIGVTVVSYIGGHLLGKKRKRWLFAVFFALEIIVLAVFKYTEFVIFNINELSQKLLSHALIGVNWDIVLPVGLSFMVFQACTYLSDVYRKGMVPEKNIIKYATFVAFFPTVLSGPIQKARNLLPQISNPLPFDYDQAKQGTLLFVWGAFEKIMVANKLSQVYSYILLDYQNHSSAEVLIGAVCFSLYIYADFSSYSDMARGVGKLMGIDVGKNFNNPYLSKTTSEFWNRWHMSLNEWFIENIYIPLGGNRKGVFRKYMNVMIVFAISGLWHGASWHFVVWGVLNGAFVIIGQVLKPLKSRIYGKTGVAETVESIVFLKRMVVFFLITLTWVFFTSPITDSLEICKMIICFDFLSIFNQNLLNIAGTAASTFVMVLATVAFCRIQLKRENEESFFAAYNRQPFFLQCLPVAILICVCAFGSCATDANVNTQFLYFQF